MCGSPFLLRDDRFATVGVDRWLHPEGARYRPVFDSALAGIGVYRPGNCFVFMCAVYNQNGAQERRGDGDDRPTAAGG
jgi:hypothetical protein